LIEGGGHYLNKRKKEFKIIEKEKKGTEKLRNGRGSRRLGGKKEKMEAGTLTKRCGALFSRLKKRLRTE